MKKLRFWWKELLATFWFVPVWIILMAVLLAFGAIYVDSQWEFTFGPFSRFLFTESPASARNLLTTIAGAMVGVAGTVFSITLVVLTLASSQFGPRIIRNFMYIRLNQVVLGAYIALFAYCLIGLNAVKDNETLTFVPSLSVFLAVLGAVVNVFLLIVFIHQVAVSIQANTVVSTISETMFRNIRNLFPEELGEEPHEQREVDEAGIGADYSHETPLRAIRNGYLQYLHEGALLRLASNKDWLVELYYRPGDYIVNGVRAGRVFSREEPEPEELDYLLDQFILGDKRVPQQDAEYAIHQMVEIAARALSPGINDPFTAIVCIDNLTSVLAYLMGVKLPARYRYDEEEKLRLITDQLDYAGMLDAAFNQIRQFAVKSPAVLIKLMEALLTLHRIARRAGQRRAVQRHARMVLHLAGKHFEESADYEDLEERSREMLGEGSD